MCYQIRLDNYQWKRFKLVALGHHDILVLLSFCDGISSKLCGRLISELVSSISSWLQRGSDAMQRYQRFLKQGLLWLAPCYFSLPFIQKTWRQKTATLCDIIEKLPSAECWLAQKSTKTEASFSLSKCIFSGFWIRHRTMGVMTFGSFKFFLVISHTKFSHMHFSHQSGRHLFNIWSTL